LSSGDSGPDSFIYRFVPSESGSPVTLLLLHGTGGSENDLLGLGSQILPGAALLSPRGKVLENGNPRFFRRFAEGVFDVNDLVLRTGELARFVQKTSNRKGFGKNVIVVGYSNGANIAASLLLLSPGLLGGAVLLRPMVPFTMEAVPDLSRVRILIEAGSSDVIVPKDQPEALAGIFRRAKADVTLQWHDAGHQITRPDIEIASKWLAEFSQSLST
jgi:phospholipase/carboxylesterase